MSEPWEYRIIEGSNKGMTGDAIRQGSEEILNNFGLQGWECYHVNSNAFPSLFYLKRRM